MEFPFHLSLPCNDIDATHEFYSEFIGASIGRVGENWLDIDLFGHQMTFTKAGKFNFNNPNYVFEGKILPSFHFGVIVDQETWTYLFNKLKDLKLEVVNKTIFLEGKVGQHQSFFVMDPNDYTIEFKCFNSLEETFKT